MVVLSLIFTFWDDSNIQGIYLGDYEQLNCYEIANTLNTYSTTGVGYTCEPLEP